LSNDEDAVQAFHNHGFKKEAQQLRKRVRELQALSNRLEMENQEMKVRITSRFIRVPLDRGISLRREHLITLHNVLEHLRSFGELIPHEDFRSLGFSDHRTLHRSCNRFVEEGFLLKQRSNPSVFKMNPDATLRDHRG
tara:strand:+ start:1001 stop:1414 length:414 start_codon:yes stop_codon:yes gene_type:complete